MIKIGGVAVRTWGTPGWRASPNQCLVAQTTSFSFQKTMAVVGAPERVLVLPADLPKNPGRFGSFEQHNCAICLGGLSRPVELACGHCFCKPPLVFSALPTNRTGLV